MFFSNKNRGIKIFWLCLIIGLLCAYGFIQGPKASPSLFDYDKDQEKFDGRKIGVLYGKVEEIYADGFLVKDDNIVANVYFKESITFSNIKIGQDVSVEGIYHKGNLIEGERFHVHKFRMLKYLVSLATLIFVLCLFFKQFKFNFKRFLFIEKNA